MLQHPFYFAARTIESPKSCNNVTKGHRFEGPGDQRNAEQATILVAKNQLLLVKKKDRGIVQ